MENKSNKKLTYEEYNRVLDCIYDFCKKLDIQNVQKNMWKLDFFTSNKDDQIMVQRISNRAEKINENAANIEKIAITETFSVGDKVKDMYRALIKYKKFTFNKLFTLKKHSKNEVVTAFTGLLEMSRRNKVVTEQDELFGDIEVEKSKFHPKQIED